MFDRTRTPTLASVIAAVTVVVIASAAGAQQEQEPRTRHVDVEAGVGVHWGVNSNVSLTDDLYTGLGFAVPLGSSFDVEAQLAYFTGRDRDDDSARDGVHFNAGARYYPWTDPETRARPYLSLGAGLWTDYREGDSVTPGMSVGVGIRLRAGDRTGFLVRVPLFLALEGGVDPMLTPTLNYFYEF